MKIQILSAETASRIAAGEVVERPASVVKELIENSLDAGAGEISVWVEKSGTALIRVADNGEGMGPDDLALVGHRRGRIAPVVDQAAHPTRPWLQDLVGQDAGHQLADTILIGVYHLGAFRFAHLLHDDLLGGLGGDTAEFHRRQRFCQEVADLGFGRLGLGELELDLAGRLFHFLDDFEQAPHAGFARTGYLSRNLA